MTEEIRCYLYWIRTEEMTDIFTEGYVGISYNPNYRYQQHKSNAKTNSHHKYKKAFRKALLEGTTILEVKLVSTLEYCLDIERKLRPFINVAWNRAIGGDGGYNYKHGLTGSKCKGAYYNMLLRAQEQGSTICDEWVGESALEDFCRFYTDNILNDRVMYTSNLTHFSPETVIFKTRKEMIAERFRVHDLYGDGVLYNVGEIGAMFSIKPNTISTAMTRGLSIRQAVGLEERPLKSLEIYGENKPYTGRMTQEELLSFKDDVESGIPLMHLRSKYGYDSGNLSRLLTKFGIEIPKIYVNDIVGGIFEIASHSKLSPEDYRAISQDLINGLAKYKIAEKLNVSASTITDASKKLKFKEFLKEKKNE